MDTKLSKKMVDHLVIHKNFCNIAVVFINITMNNRYTFFEFLKKSTILTL